MLFICPNALKSVVMPSTTSSESRGWKYSAVLVDGLN